jgi:purine-binding chemotaxis protein CheW
MLDGVARVQGPVSSLVGQPPWHRGLVRHRGQQLTLVDLGALLGLRDVQPVAEPDHLLVLPGGRVGIVCDDAPVPLELTGDRIRWARPTLQRPWLAAVLPDQMCVLMDIEAIARLIGHESCL